MFAWTLLIWVASFAGSFVLFRTLFDIPRLTQLAQSWQVANGQVVEADARRQTAVVRYAVEGRTFNASLQAADLAVGSSVPLYYESGKPFNATLRPPQAELTTRWRLTWALSALVATLVAYMRFHFSRWSAPPKQNGSSDLSAAGSRF